MTSKMDLSRMLRTVAEKYRNRDGTWDYEAVMLCMIEVRLITLEELEDAMEATVAELIVDADRGLETGSRGSTESSRE
jgi:hypothetical protein